jgi:hypothetical protein
MEGAAVGETLDGGDLFTFDLHTENETRGDDSVIEDDGARAAIAVVASFLGARKTYDVAKALQKALARFAEKVYMLSVDDGLYVGLAWHLVILLGSLYSGIECASR